MVSSSLWLPLGHIPNSLPLALELISKISITHRPQVCLMLGLWKSLCQRICNIQILMYLAHLNFTSPNKLSNEVKLLQHMFVLLVIPRLFSVRNRPIVVTMYIQWARRIWKHTKFNEEPPHRNTFLRRFRSCNVLSLCCRIGHYHLLGTFLAYCTTIYREHKTWLWLWIIYVSLEANIGVTIYNELLLTSIN